MLLALSDLNGYRMEAAATTIGVIADCLFDDRTWKVRWLVVDAGSWLTGRRLLVHPSAVMQTDHERCVVAVDLTIAQLANGPSVRMGSPICRDVEERFFDYYGWDPYWGDSAFGANALAAPLGVASVLEERQPGSPHGAANRQPDGDPHLRSIAEVSSYEIRAIDGTIGHLETFLIDDENWTIRYLVVDTANWWIGKHVLVAPAAVTEFAWGQRFVRLNLTCYKIKGSPAWDDTGIVDRAYEQMLRLYYGWGALGDDRGHPAEAALVSPVAVSANASSTKEPV